MADIFLSYANEDREVARKLSRLLAHAGWTVWWDRRIPAGSTWRKMLESALRDMRCMVVLWSSHSIESDWVKEEAEEARLRKKLVPVLIEAVIPPVGFRTIQAADLTDWDGAGESLGVRQLIADLELILGKPGAQAQIAPRARMAPGESAGKTRTELSFSRVKLAKRGAELETPSGRGSSAKNAAGWKLAAGAGVTLVLAVGMFALWREWAPVTDELATAVATMPARSTREIPPAPKIEKLVVYGARQELEPDQTLPLSVHGRFSDGTENEIRSAVEWSSSNSRVARVDGMGRVTALQSGATQITAAHGGETSAAWELTVKAREVKAPAARSLVALAVKAHKTELEPQEKIALTVSGRYSDGSEKTLSRGWVLASSNAAVVSVNTGGEAAAGQAGNAEVIARSGNVTSAPLRLIVKEPQWKVAVPPRQRRRNTEYAPPKTPADAVATKTPQARPAAPEVDAEHLRANIASYVDRARNFRIQGNYAAALSQLASARAVDPSSAEIRAEIEQTKRACLAEKKLGRKGLDC